MSRLQKIVRSVHGWVGALFTLYLFVISLSGTLLLWKQAYLWLAIPEARADFEPTPQTLAPIAADIETRQCLRSAWLCRTIPKEDLTDE
jgi:uncharacterized iron-regulated membrane protein